MSEATLIYPHQLFFEHPALATDRVVYLIEEPLFFTENPIHRQRLMLHKLSMDTYERHLCDQGYTTIRLDIDTYPTTQSVFDRITTDGVHTIHVADTTDDLLEQALGASGLERMWYESPLFILSKTDATERYTASGRHLARFYKKLRQDMDILVEPDGSPSGGSWSFDRDNRRALLQSITLPTDLAHYRNGDVAAAATWASGVAAQQYGETEHFWLPYTHAGAAAYFRTFLEERFDQFGPYEDALTDRGVRLFHSAITPLLNIGLITPDTILHETIAYARTHEVPIQSLEGFVRQVLGWREFMRAAYEVDGRAMRTTNFWQHRQPLPNQFWTGTTTLPPVDRAITRALTYGYTHHIERLMVLGNCMLLLEIDPNDVYRWFMGMYLDAYDWVMVPNVYGMSQFADGGRFATKPYISGSNYIQKMSDYAGGEWAAVWTALYWRFISTHRTFFAGNHRLAMMPRLLDKMKPETMRSHQETADTFLDQLRAQRHH